MPTTYSPASPAQQGAIEAFLMPRMTSSSILLSNMRSVGLVFEGKRYQGDYALALEDGEVAGVIAHYWNGMLMLQAPTWHIDGLIEAVVAKSRRPVRGVMGLLDQVQTARAALGISPDQIQLDEPEVLYALTLVNLREPAALRDGTVAVRRATDADLDVLTRWRVGFATESLNEAETPELWRAMREAAAATIAERRIWIAEADGAPVAMTAFNARIAECAQVGGVYTPLEHRSRGYARCAVAHSLLVAAAEGVTHGVLFTPDTNTPAQRAYEALGFERIGRFGLLFLKA
jgi:ribosomal protein S18 acetylase RimI-like enzyme